MDKFKNMLLLQLSSNLNSFCVFKEKTILEGGIFFCGGWNFSKSVSVTSSLLER